MTEEKEKILFYNKFVEQRKKINKNLVDISAETKVNIKYLEAIESGDFDILPNVYIRLFLRTYSDYLELNSDEILNDYDAFMNISNQQLKTSGVTYIKKKLKRDYTLKPKKEKVTKDESSTQSFTETESDNDYFFRPSKIISILLLFFGIILIYLFIDNLNDNKNLNINKLSTHLEMDIDNNYQFRVITNADTKLNISYKDTLGAETTLCNEESITETGLLKFSLDRYSILHFTINNMEDISSISINNESIATFMNNEDIKNSLIKGFSTKLFSSYKFKFILFTKFYIIYLSLKI